MNYSVRLHVPEGLSSAQKTEGEHLFRRALEDALGDPGMVVPVYRAYLGIVARHGESPDPDALNLDERVLLEHWAQAEAAALQAVFGPHRHLDEGGYDIELAD